jgi:hypothetical protein
MTVYVDDMYLYPMGKYGRMKMSHMIADTDSELHAMADVIGVQRKWWQAPPKHDSHYDVAIVMRSKAIEAGAVPIALRELSFMTLFRRVHQRLPTAEERAIFNADRAEAIARLLSLRNTLEVND